MSEKRGYPNPDYTEEDVLEVKADLRIDDNEYRELCYKAAALDILAARIKARRTTPDSTSAGITTRAARTSAWRGKTKS